MKQIAFHPGEHLQEELDALSLSAESLVLQLRVPTDQVIAVLAGRQNITAELALRLGHFFGTTAQFWLNLQALFDLETAKQKFGAEINMLPTLQAA